MDDFLVNTDKIGSSNFYWSFPSQTYHAKKIQTEQLKSQIADLGTRLEVAKSNLEEARSVRCAPERDAKVRRKDLLRPITNIFLVRKISDVKSKY